MRKLPAKDGKLVDLPGGRSTRLTYIGVNVVNVQLSDGLDAELEAHRIQIFLKSQFQFSNLCGTVYKQGNIVFTADGNSVLSPVGNCVSVFDLVNDKSSTLSFENRKNIAAIALSPDSNVLVSVDEDGRALLVNFKRGVVPHHFKFHKAVKAIKFSPDANLAYSEPSSSRIRTIRPPSDVHWAP
ncbi:U3 snoRNP protein [Taiwanofungus camphoratus]|nr:U3 snoRNP protein [Antrodia cinnamomea]